MTALKKLHVLVAISLMVIACEPKKDLQKEAAEIYAESMKIHDAVMPRMDELFTLRQKLTLKLDSLKGDSVVNAAGIEEIRKSIADLAAADKGMMDWMHSVQDVPGIEGEHSHHGGDKSAAESLPIDEVIKNQQTQKEAIENVKRDMEESITRAKELLGTK